MNAIDTYINNAAEVAQPILIHLRHVIKDACPAIEEQLKWNAPSFELNGKIICSLMAFKGHVNFMITQGKLLNLDIAGLENIGEKSNMTGIKGIKKVSDLPTIDVLIKIINAAIEHSKF